MAFALASPQVGTTESVLTERRLVVRYLLAFVTASLFVGYASAGYMLAPVSATTNMPTSSSNLLDKMFDQSGLSAHYTSGVTDFDTFTSTTTHDNGVFLANCWAAINFATTGHIDFYLGGTNTVDKLAMWVNANDSSTKGFTLYASQDDTFASSTNLGTFSAIKSGSAQVFTFASTSANYIRMDISSTQGTSFGAVIGEVAFSTQQAAEVPAVVPAPASIISFSFFMLAGGLARMRRLRAKA